MTNKDEVKEKVKNIGYEGIIVFDVNGEEFEVASHQWEGDDYVTIEYMRKGDQYTSVKTDMENGQVEDDVAEEVAQHIMNWSQE